MTRLASPFIDYPESDGKPMGETEFHKLAIMRMMDILTRYFENEPVHVTGDLLLFYEEGNPKKFIVPDVFVVKGTTKHLRRNYLIWEEERVPNVVFEVTSKKTKKRDQIEKAELYRKLGINEYFLFDPLSEYLDTQLIGYRLVDGAYQRIPTDDSQRMMSEELGLFLVVDENLEFYVPQTGERLLDSKEDSAAKNLQALQARAQVDQVMARATQAEASANEAKALAKNEAARANEAEARANEAEARARNEAARANEAEARAQKQGAHVDELSAKLAEAQALLAQLQAQQASK